MSERTRLAVVFGGASPEHEVSVMSARSILREADPERFETVPFGVTRGGAWLTPAETGRRLAGVADEDYPSLGDETSDGVLAHRDALEALASTDVVFPIVHGPTGEDGTLQGLLELAGMPYVGSGVAASAVGMDKSQMRAVLATHGIPQARYLVLRDRDLEAPAGADIAGEIVENVERSIGYPCFVKPSNGGSSIGVSKARSREDLGTAISEAARFDRKVLVEEALDGREVECAVLGNAEPEASPLGEIRPRSEFYSYEAKYGSVGADLVIPAELSDGTSSKVRQVAVGAYLAIDCAGLARVDCFVTPRDEIRVIELNTLPGFTPISMYPRLWEHAGLPYRELISRLVDLALERHDETQQLRSATPGSASSGGRHDG